MDAECKRMIQLSIFIVQLLAPTLLLADARSESRKKDVPPTVVDFAYGRDSERQRLDFWRAKSGHPTPVVVMIHGGGWIRGDKSAYGYNAVRPYLDAGISVARINYRYISTAMEEGADPPVKACLHDAARAVQTIRSHAKEWNVDPSRIGATGGSAGACTSLWLALHDDLKDLSSSDPVARESTRLSCTAVDVAQTSLDPKQLREWRPNAEYGGHAFGFSKKGRDWKDEFELLLANREKLLPLIKEYSPIEWVSRDDPPIFLDYMRVDAPLEAGKPQADPTHSAIQGIMLGKELEEQAVEVVVSYKGHQDTRYGTIEKFLIAKLAVK
jgi:acetyl esterase/lipase